MVNKPRRCMAYREVFNMINRLKNMIDLAEDMPKVKEVLLMVAQMEEKNQEDALKFIEVFCGL